MWCAAQEFLNVILVRAAMTATSAGSQKKKNCNSCSLCSQQGKIFFNSCNIGSAKKYFSALAKHISVNTVNYVVLLSIWMKEFEDMFEGFQKSLLFQFT